MASFFKKHDNVDDSTRIFVNNEQSLVWSEKEKLIKESSPYSGF
jgi:hypothetical protein